VLAGLRQQAAIAKCKAWTDPIHTKSVRENAARKEHLAREAADAANTIAAEKPQAPQFQNSPLKVFGEHDHATVA
jgi:hypothetical protein